MINHVKYRFVKYAIFCSITMSFFICCEKDDLDKSNTEKDSIEIMEGPENDSIPCESDMPAGEISCYTNLLKNGSFEKWILFSQYDIPDGWLCHNNKNATKDMHTVFDGHYSVKMCSRESGKTATVDQVVPVTAGHKIRIYFHYYVEQWKSSGARCYCYFRTMAAEKYNIPADVLRQFYDENTYRIIRGGGYGLTYFPHDLHKWILYDEIIEVPPTARYFVFGINSYYGTTIYVDDCYVVDIGEIN